MTQICVLVNGQYTKLIEFSGNNGENPTGSPILSDSVIYGTAQSGGINYGGVVFKVNTEGTGFQKIHEFSYVDGGVPNSDLILKDNTLFGVTALGGAVVGDSGVIFKMNIDGTGFKLIHEFNITNGSSPEFCSPILIDSIIYGATTKGGAYGMGVVYRVDTNGSGYKVLHEFNFNDGAWPRGPLVLSGDTLYGTTRLGSSKGYGSIFRINTDGSGFTNLFDFDATTGEEPSSLSLLGRTFFGMTSSKIYKIGMDGKNFEQLLDFNTVPGHWPYGCYLSIVDTFLYGMTNRGGIGNDYGTAFRIDTSGNNYQLLYDFDVNDGIWPSGSLIVSDKTLYGITTQGGKNDDGVLFKLILCTDVTINKDTAIAINGKCKLPDGTIVQDSGTYITSYKTTFDCDSTIATHVTTLNCNDTSFQIDKLIAGDVSYILPGGETVYLPGIYTDSLKNVNGCDSIIITNLNFLCRDTILLVDTLMVKHGTYTLPGGEIVNTAGIYIDTLKSTNGCDSVIITNLSIKTNILENNETNRISIYPNPTNEYVIINTNLKKYNISIIDITGKILIYKGFNYGSIKLNVNDLKEGVYFINVTNQSGNELIKLIKLN